MATLTTAEKTTSEPLEDHPLPPSEPVPVFKRPRVLRAGMILLPILLLAVALIIARAFTRESTDDAFIDGNTVFIAPRVAGKVVSLAVNDNQLVPQGAPLFEIDPADFAARAEQDRQAVAVDEATAASKEAAYQQALAHVDTAHSYVASAQASAEQAQADAAKLQDDLTRAKALVQTKVISQQEYDDTSKNTLSALAAAKSKVAQQSAASTYETESTRQLESAKAEWQSAQAQVAQEQAALTEANLQLSYTKVAAPVAGRVTQRSVNSGDYVQIGQQVLALVPMDLWVTANFKETQLRHMQPGQPVEIHVDAYPDKVLRGHVDSIQAGSGAQFSLLPPENATGNYVKVVQRVPVKIVLDEPDSAHILGPGMSVEPTVLVNASRSPYLAATALALAASAGVVLFGRHLIRRETLAH